MFATRLDATPAPAVRHTSRMCAECGSEFFPLKGHSEFCREKCRSDFNNRRALRGAELYDIFMALRYERPKAAKLRLWWLICHMAMGFRDQDHLEREGRKSWRDPRIVASRHAYLHATVVGKHIAGRRRWA